MKPKRIRCIRDTGQHRYGRIYTVIGDGEDYKCDQNPSGKTFIIEASGGGFWFADWFEVIGCQCPVKFCIAKHARTSIQ